MKSFTVSLLSDQAGLGKSKWPLLMALKISGSLCPLEVRVVRFNKKMKKRDDITYVSICGLQKIIK